MKKHAGHIKSLKKLLVRSGDIVVVTLKGTPARHVIDEVYAECSAMPFMKNINLIVTTDQVVIEKSGIKDGKHQVFLDNLEYLEYLAKHKGD